MASVANAAGQAGGSCQRFANENDDTREVEAYWVDKISELISQNAPQVHTLDTGVPPAKPWK